jgi:hypothetical protein
LTILVEALNSDAVRRHFNANNLWELEEENDDSTPETIINAIIEGLKKAYPSNSKALVTSLSNIRQQPGESLDVFFGRYEIAISRLVKADTVGRYEHLHKGTSLQMVDNLSNALLRVYRSHLSASSAEQHATMEAAKKCVMDLETSLISFVETEIQRNPDILPSDVKSDNVPIYVQVAKRMGDAGGRILSRFQKKVNIAYLASIGFQKSDPDYKSLTEENVTNSRKTTRYHWDRKAKPVAPPKRKATHEFAVEDDDEDDEDADVEVKNPRRSKRNRKENSLASLQDMAKRRSSDLSLLRDDLLEEAERQAPASLSLMAITDIARRNNHLHPTDCQDPSCGPWATCPQIVCFYCRQKGHIRQCCPSLVSPPGFSGTPSSALPGAPAVNGVPSSTNAPPSNPGGKATGGHRKRL